MRNKVRRKQLHWFLTANHRPKWRLNWKPKRTWLNHLLVRLLLRRRPHLSEWTRFAYNKEGSSKENSGMLEIDWLDVNEGKKTMLWLRNILLIVWDVGGGRWLKTQENFDCTTLSQTPNPLSRFDWFLPTSSLKNVSIRFKLSTCAIYLSS